MNETLTTVRGNIVNNPTTRRVGDDIVLNFRVASNTRRQDRDTGEWRTTSTLFLAVSCWGNLARQASGRLFMGDAVIVQGRLHSNEYERDGVPTRDTEMRCYALGPDMSRMDVTVKRLKKVDRPGDDDEADVPTDVSGLEEAPEGDLVGAAAGETADAGGPRGGGTGAPF
ncbi:single-stranded DNA-binding protein [Dietzia sp. 179-F 9C3 NHS]|uniref:single-stranded DNA-binding protein n=1 Tax=Dietzia sp. 179-F 9C3 NHS TaxID=3374295 RepID=UPI00387A2CAC